MSASEKTAKNGYSWLILIVAVLALFFGSTALVQLGGLLHLFFDPNAAYGFTPTQFAMVMTMPCLVKHLGAVGGIQSNFQNLGAWICPAYIIALICTSLTSGTFFSLMSGGAFVALFAGIFVTPPEQRRHQGRGQLLRGRGGVELRLI